MYSSSTAQGLSRHRIPRSGAYGIFAALRKSGSYSRFKTRLAWHDLGRLTITISGCTGFQRRQMACPIMQTEIHGQLAVLQSACTVNGVPPSHKAILMAE